MLWGYHRCRRRCMHAGLQVVLLLLLPAQSSRTHSAP